MKYIYQILLILLFSPMLLYSQMWNGQDTLYGNEWINFDQQYFKIKVSEDGIYRISYEALTNIGIPANAIEGNQFQLFRMGEEVPLYLSNETTLGAGDYLEFYGEKNKAELDRYLFKDPDNELLNPNYSLFNDEISYYLTWSESTSTVRYQTIENDLNNLPAKEEYYWHELLYNNTSRHIKREDEVDIKQSYFDKAEGFSGVMTNAQNVTLEPDAIHALTDSSIISIRLATNARSHDLSISLNGEQRISDQFYGFDLRQYNFKHFLGESDNELIFDFVGLQASNDRQSIANISLTYPRKFDFGNADFYQFNLEESAAKRYVEIENFSGTNPVVYDINNQQRILVESNGTQVRVALPGLASERRLVMAGASAIREVQALAKVDFIDYTNRDADFIFISHQDLMTSSNGTNQVQEYANYRASNIGGNYSPILVDIQQVYEQFAYGVDRHNIAIRNFGHFINRNWSNPKYIFLVGKAVEYQEVRRSPELEENLDTYFFVPTFGSPGGDNLLLSNNFDSEPIIPIGRLSAVNAEEIRIYLQKVKDFEANVNLPQTQEDKEWMKRIVHLGGGDVSIQNLIKNHLSAIENIIIDNQFGAEVSSFYKSSSEPIQISASEQILNLINEGVSIITFFGHSGSNTFDFSLDSPETYDNQGKYPVMFSLGCYSGQIHGASRGISERFLFEEDKGAIGFFASTSLSYISGLRVISEEYYRLLGSSYYGKGLGDVLKQVIRIHENNNGTGIDELTQQFTLHGDPSLVLNAQPGPDYLVDTESVEFEPGKVNIELDSFEIRFDLVNIGANKVDSLSVEVMQKFPSGGELLIVKDKVKAPASKLSLTYAIPVYKDAGVGLNEFFIKVDAEDDIEELPVPDAELNNNLVNSQGQQGISIYFTSNVAQPIYPAEFGIVNESNLILKASTANTFADEKQYVLQLDTTQAFNSNFLKETDLIQRGGVLKWEPSINWENDIVYYWRVSPDSIDEAGFNWRSSSFLYKENVENGWNQSHYYQQLDDSYSNMELSEASRKMKYLDDFKDIRITQGVYPIVFPEVAINSQGHTYFPWDDPIRAGLFIVELDSISIDPRYNSPMPDNGEYGSQIPPWVGDSYGAFPFNTQTQAKRNNAIYFLDSIVQSGNYVVVISIQETNIDYEPEEWAADSITNNGRNLFNLLEEQGASMIRSTATNGAVPYFFVYKKDDPSFTPVEGLGNLESITSRIVNLVGSWDRGRVETERIGPARNWESLEWQLSDFNPDSDGADIDIIGVRADSIEVLLVEGITATDTSLSFIDAASYPYLRLRYNSIDSTFRSPAHIDHWRVYYTGLPEMALNPELEFSFYKDTLQQGDELKLQLGLENIGQYDMDSLLLHFSVVDENNTAQGFDKRLKPLLKGDSLIANFNLTTRNLSGDYALVIEANPNKDQPEQFHFNNIGLNNFYVEKDKRNPLLDVTFDGVHIMDGDLVSAKPFILVSLEDENAFLELGDTSLFNLFLQYPNETALRPIAFDSEVVQFFPALANDLEEKNRATIEIYPEFEQDGLYQLIVQAEDATGNQSGRIDYKIAFQVINKSMISNVFNYPNPFSTSTQFVYTLTGATAPDFFKIQIMTVSGRIVKEITQEELGQLKPGTHRTEYTWDGTDEYGDRLANGVYLYRVITKNSLGEDIEKYDTGTDQFFFNNIGKLVILR